MHCHTLVSVPSFNRQRFAIEGTRRLERGGCELRGAGPCPAPRAE
jgi:hypothetical protein